MVVEQVTQYAHRTNFNGSFDSICKFCFRTIGSSRNEADLNEPERFHACMDSDLMKSRGLRLPATQHSSGN